MVFEQRTGVPMVVSAPSGGGKTTLCRRLVGALDRVEFSVSHTTRALRGTERHGVDYHFVDDDEFDRLISEEAFLEWAHVHDHRYGTARREASTRLDRGVDVLFDIDVQGGRQIAEYVEGAVLVFVLPPDMETLEKRLRGRGSDADDVIARRLTAAQKEIEQASSLYTHWIVNDNLDVAFDELRSVLVAERLRRVKTRQLVDTMIKRSAP